MVKRIWAFRMACAAAVVSGAVCAEFRTWVDVNGIALEAEYFNISGDQVILKGRNKLETRVHREMLSEKDLLYVDLKNPPRMTINVNSTVSRKSVAAHRNTQVKRESVQCKVTIKKSSPMPYSAALRAELYTIGKRVQHGDYVLMDKTVSTFSFEQESGSPREHRFEGELINLTKAQGGGKVGGAYEGYLIVITDQNHDVLDVKSNRTVFRDNYEAIREMKELTIFDKNLETRKKTANPKNMPDRRFGRRR